MSDQDLARRRALQDLVRMVTPVADAVSRLASLPWDSDAEYVTLTRVDAVRVLDAFIDGGFNAYQVGEWADAIEARDGIGLEAGHESLLKDFIFILANPELNGAMSTEAASRWRAALNPESA